MAHLEQGAYDVETVAEVFERFYLVVRAVRLPGEVVHYTLTIEFFFFLLEPSCCDTADHRMEVVALGLGVVL